MSQTVGKDDLAVEMASKLAGVMTPLACILENHQDECSEKVLGHVAHSLSELDEFMQLVNMVIQGSQQLHQGKVN